MAANGIGVSTGFFHLEQRLRDLGAGKDPNAPFIAPRPDIDVSGVDASQ